MTFEPATQATIALSFGVGVAIKVTEQRVPMMHVGVIFASESEGTKLLHLATHEALRCDPFEDPDYHWSDCEWLGTGRYFGASDHLLNAIECAARRSDIPYGFKTPRRLHGPAGERIEIERDEGVTCATYVALLFADAGYSVVDLASWESRKDDAVGSELIMGHLQARHPERYAVVKDQEMPYRLRPHEAATAAASASIPMVFADAERLSRPLYEILIPTDQSLKRLSNGTGAIAS